MTDQLPGAVAQEVSLAAGLDQIAAGIDKALGICVDINPEDESTAKETEAPPLAGARYAVRDCEAKLVRLNQRLERIAGLVGRI